MTCLGDVMRKTVLAGCCLLCVTSCQNPPYPRGSLAELYPTGPRPTLSRVRVDGRELEIARMAGTGEPDVLFIHGSPGDWKAWASYLNDPRLDDLGSKVAVDRPGYGGSAESGVIPDLRQQAALLAQLLPQHKKTIVVGHSLGGPLAAWLAIDHPEQVCGVVMLAGAMAPAYEAPRWYNRMAASWLFGWLIPDEMRRSNLEIMPLQQELIKLDHALPDLHRPMMVLQGSKDELVDPRTPDYLQQRIDPHVLSIIRIPDVGHFIPWKKHLEVIQAIHAMAQQCRGDGLESKPS